MRERCTAVLLSTSAISSGLTQTFTKRYVIAMHLYSVAVCCGSSRVNVKFVVFSVGFA